MLETGIGAVGEAPETLLPGVRLDQIRTLHVGQAEAELLPVVGRHILPEEAGRERLRIGGRRSATTAAIKDQLIL